MTTRLVVVGGDAGGMAAASQVRRRRADMDVVALEQGPDTSWSACGIPAVLGGEVASLRSLVVRAPQEFRALGIDIRMGHRATEIDLAAGAVTVRNLAHERTYKLGFDLLHLGTGARPVRPDIPGLDGARVHGVQTLADAGALEADLADRSVRSAVIVGGGYIGLEMAEALVRRGLAVTVVTDGPEVMASLDPDMGALVSQAMTKQGIVVRLGERVLGIEGSTVTTDMGTIVADVVVLGLGVEPVSELAGEAGVDLGERGAIVVDRRQRTSVPQIYAAGDCCQSVHLVSGRPTYLSLGTVANRMARVAGINLAGGYATFPGVVGTAATRLCALEVARTGLSESEATAAGFGHVAVRIEATTKAGYFPGAAPITVKLVVEQDSGRLLGGQIVGGDGSAKRIDVVATALMARMSAADLVDLDLAYAPPFSTVWDPVQVAARAALDELG